jgi:CheY-like chemotaxis protein
MMTTKPLAALAGKRILVVEDEILVYMLIESVLEEHECEALPPAPRVPAALAMVAADSFAADAAILDLNLAGEPVYPVAERLTEKGVPFLFLTGYGEGALDERFKGRPIVQKPFRDGALLETLIQTLATASSSGSKAAQSS